MGAAGLEVTGSIGVDTGVAAGEAAAGFVAATGVDAAGFGSGVAIFCSWVADFSTGFVVVDLVARGAIVLSYSLGINN